MFVDTPPRIGPMLSVGCGTANEVVAVAARSVRPSSSIAVISRAA